MFEQLSLWGYSVLWKELNRSYEDPMVKFADHCMFASITHSKLVAELLREFNF